MVKVFAIDPGTTESGFVLFDSVERRVIEKGIVKNEELLLRSTWVDCDIVCIENVASYGMAVGQTTFTTVIWIGRYIQYAVSNGIDYKLLFKKVDINPAICFTNKAKDANIRQAIIDMFPATGGGKVPQVGNKKEPGPLFGVTSHMFAALAVALTYCLQNDLIKRKP